MNVQYVNNIASAAVSTIGDIFCSTYLPAKIAQLVATGTKIALNLLYKTDESLEAYYKLKVTSVIEESLRKQIVSVSGDYLRRENLNESSYLYAVIDLYCSAISKGYEYTFDYLKSVEKDSEYIYSSYVHNTNAFKQFEKEVENEYYSLYNI